MLHWNKQNTNVRKMISIICWGFNIKLYRGIEPLQQTSAVLVSV